MLVTPYYWFARVLVLAEMKTYSLIIWILVMAVGFLAIAYLAYAKRPAEAAGRAMAFNFLKPVVKIALAVPATLLIALSFSNITASFGYVALGIILTSVLFCCLLEVIYEFDIKAALKKKRHILVSGVLSTLIFLIYALDLFGYDSYVPQPEKVKSYALIMLDGYGNNTNFFKENGAYISAGDYARLNMFASDAENICTLAEIQPDTQHYQAEVLYRLTNGREVKRKIWFDVENPETIALLNSIVSTEEYKKGAFMVMADYFDEVWMSPREGFQKYVRYDFGAYSYQIEESDLKRLVDAYRADLRYIDFSDMHQTLPYGNIMADYWPNNQNKTINYEINDDYYHYYAYMNIPVMQDCVKTLSILTDLGANIAEPIKSADVDYIEVTYSNLKEWNEANLDLTYFDTSGIVSYAEIYQEAEEIEAIVRAVWPASWNSANSLQAKLYEPDYELRIVFKAGTDPQLYNTRSYGGYSYSYRFKAGILPEFVLQLSRNVAVP
jgi:hypothetical protein